VKGHSDVAKYKRTSSTELQYVAPAQHPSPQLILACSTAVQCDHLKAEELSYGWQNVARLDASLVTT
jgi:hypothetical protein